MNPKQQYLTIQEFAQAIGVCTQTVRRWDKQGKLSPHHKTPNGYRMYTQEQIENYLKK
jgi:DNA-binding transcriptional MerR regulator